MAMRDEAVQLKQLSAKEVMSLALGEIGILAAVELLRLGGYPRPTDEQFRAIARAVSQAALAMPHMVEDMASTSNEQLEAAAVDLGVAAVRTLLGPPPAAN